MHDPWWRLRPPPPTPADELCACAGTPDLVLQPHLTANPVVCAACHLEVPPERLAPSEALAEQIAGWNHYYEAVYRLWLDSAELEAWAAAQLSDATSPANVRAFALRDALARLRPTWLWWFVDGVAPGACPRCAGPLEPRFGHHGCPTCFVLVAAG